MSRLTPTLQRPEIRVGLVLAGLLWALRLAFVLRRPDLVRSVSDVAWSFAAGALVDLAFAFAAGAVAGLLHRLSLTRISFVFSCFVAFAATFLAAVETEYFAFSRNRFDQTFVVYTRELSAIGGSVSGEMSYVALGLHLVLVIAAMIALVRFRPAPARFSVAPVAQLAVALVVAYAALSHPRRAETWFGAMASRTPAIELAHAIEAASQHALPAAGVAFTDARSFTNPLSSKRFVDDATPLAHLGGRAPEGTYGPHRAGLNVLFIMLEGMEAASLAASGGTRGLTPELDRLASEHLYFKRFFANGAHTPRALDASLCGLAPRLTGAPLSRAQPQMPVACLPQILRERGYSTAFVHGGLESFENRFEFLGHIGFRETLFYEQFGRNVPKSNGGWGATDAQTYEQAEKWLDARDPTRPFFLTVLSISNHHPFHVPDPTLEIEHDEARLSDNTIRYADREVGRFLESLKNKGLLDSTIVFVFGDHGLTRSNLNGDPGASMAERMLARANVPLLVLGPEGLFPRRIEDHLASQNDLLPTVLDVLGLDAPNHAMGHSLGWTWAAGGRDLPVFVHDLYSQLAATVTPDSLQITGLEGHDSEAAGSWRWSRDETGFHAERAELDKAREASLRGVVSAIDALYAEERWWSPALAGTVAATH